MTAVPPSTALRPTGGIVLAHPSGNQFFRHLAESLRDAGRLTEICTCIDWRGEGWAARRLPAGIAAELNRRSFSRGLGVPVTTHPWREMARLGAGRLGLRGLVRHETGYLSVDAVYRDFDRWVAHHLRRAQGAGIVYAYEDAAEATFTTAARLGWTRVYDLPIAHWETSRRLLDEEAQRWPEWEPTLGGTRDSPEKNARKSRELSLANLVVCPSRFVAESLPTAGSESRSVVIAPFGSPPVEAPPPQAPRSGPLRVLFAGSMTQRKGLADLFAAVKLLRRSDVELVVLGSPVADLAFYRRVGPRFTYEVTRPHAAVLALMRTCDVLCLPSIVEGRALVVQEAMSVGLPVIVTSQTGTDDVARAGGFVVPIRAPEAIAERIAWLADNRSALPALGATAQVVAAGHSWAGYGAAIVGALGGARADVALPVSGGNLSL